ncbi:MAG: hypothetical protein HC897_19960 [Thermoanaerobaculia bacterium]|nr:hypothetical protein [Thermoanaerobaculia bacterium]
MSNGYAQPPAAPKKGLHPLAWVAIGCGGLAVLAAIVLFVGGWFATQKLKQVASDFEDNPTKAAAEMFVRINPEIEMVSSDDAAGTMTVRNTKTGEVATFKYDELEQGKLSWKTSEGEASVSFDTQGGQGGGVTVKTDKGETTLGATNLDLPEWVPIYPGANVGQGMFSARSAEGTMASFPITTSDASKDVMGYYEKVLKENGFEVQTQSYTSGEDTLGMVIGENKSNNRTVNVVITRQNNETNAAIQYAEKPVQ